jgi:hypothetical protein
LIIQSFGFLGSAVEIGNPFLADEFSHADLERNNMSKSAKYWLASVVLTLSMPPANAQSFCDALAVIASNAKNNFKAIALGTEVRKSTFSSSVVLPHAHECYIRNNSYWCTWKRAPEQLANEFKTFVDASSKCFPGVTPEYRIKETDPWATFTKDGVEFYFDLDSDEAEIDLSVKASK